MPRRLQGTKEGRRGWEAWGRGFKVGGRLLRFVGGIGSPETETYSYYVLVHRWQYGASEGLITARCSTCPIKRSVERKRSMCASLSLWSMSDVVDLSMLS